MFNMSLVPVLLSFVQLCACQNFLNPQLILAGLDGEVESLEASSSYVVWGRWQVGGWSGGTFSPKGWQLSLAFQNCIPSANPAL